MIGRRHVLVGFGLLLASEALSQSASRPRRIGVLRLGAPVPVDDVAIAGLETALRELGYDTDRTLLISYRYAAGVPDRLPLLARELLNAGVEVLQTVGLTATLAAREATTTVPIVMFGNVDPIRLGVVDNLGRPIGNVTGVLIAPEGTLAAKRLFLLREAVPQAKRFALLAPENDPAFRLQIAETRGAAAVAGVLLDVFSDQGGDYSAVFAAIKASGADALIVGAHQFYMRDRRVITELAARHQLPAIYEWPEQVAAGGLMSFGADLAERQKRIASYIDRLLNGAKPADLPFEQPAALKTVVNLRVARALQLTPSASLLAQTDELIE
jgi:putative ABC transport system substrate-binding protein